MKYQQRSNYIKKKLSAYGGSPKYSVSAENIGHDTIFCNMTTGEIKSGEIHYSDEFVNSCAQSLAHYLLDNPETLKQMESNYGID